MTPLGPQRAQESVGNDGSDKPADGLDDNGLHGANSDSDVNSDIELFLASFRLQKLRRYFHHRYWERESIEAEHADRIEGSLKLENVAAHSWHVADGVLTLAGNFPTLNIGRCLQLAIIHDKLEMFTGDFNPVGRDGKGLNTHAFNVQKQEVKKLSELEAMDHYLALVRHSARPAQEALLREAMEGVSAESRFVKAVDKLQALAFVYTKKNGDVSDSHLRFTVDYSGKAISYFPPIKQHYQCLLGKFLQSIAKKRRVDRKDLEATLFGQLQIDF